MQVTFWPTFVILAIVVTEAEIQFNKDLVGVYISPFVEEGRPQNSYSLEEIKEMLRVVKPLTRSDSMLENITLPAEAKVQSAVTAQLGAVRRALHPSDFPMSEQVFLLFDKNGLPIGAVLPDFDLALSVQRIEKLTIQPRDLCDSSALIPIAAAALNKETGQRDFTVLVAAYNNRNSSLPERDTWELDNALAAAHAANQIFPGTVDSIVLVSVPLNDWTSELLSILEAAVDASLGHGFSIGLRTDCSMSLLAGDLRDDFRRILRKVDFLHCRIFPSPKVLEADPNADEAPLHGAQDVMDRFLELKHAAEVLNPSIKVAIGETKWARLPGWADNPVQTHTKNLVTYWKTMNNLAVQNQVKILMATSFDENFGTHGKMSNNSGLWLRQVDNASKVTYIPKFSA